MLTELGATVEQVVISDLTDQVFFARISLIASGRTIEIDSRPSDAIALAVRTGTPDSRGRCHHGPGRRRHGCTMTTKPTFATASRTRIPMKRFPRPESGDDRPTPPVPRKIFGVFRDFINSLDLDDFDKKRSN